MERATLGLKIDGVYLRKLRIQRGKSVSRLAAEAGISHQFLSFIEHGRRRPMPEVFGRICDALDLDDTAAERDRLLRATEDVA